ncbi:DsbA family protein [Patescibacteria group bacterium]
MPPKKQIVQKREKIYFIYFLIFSIIILLIFTWQIITPYWDYWSSIKSAENYYKGRLLEFTTEKPSINQYDPIKGTINAKITIYEYSDYYCSACQRLNGELNALADFYGNKIRFVYKAVPITIHPQARPAIIATMCASEQNKYWEYKKLVFQNPNLITQQTFLEYAQQLNLELEAFNTCLASPRYAQVIDRNISEALRLQITSLPTIYVNEQKVEGYVDYNLLKSIIDSQL